MTTQHEYSAIGHSRTRIGRVLGLVAGSIAGAIVIAAGGIVDWLTRQNLWTPPSLILWPISGAIVFSAVFFVFDRLIWRISGLSKLLGVPNLSGDWIVAGETRDQNGNTTYNWEGSITITQNYEKIHVFLRTAQSSSNSVSAAIIPEGDVGYRLIYSYRNAPRAGEHELLPHIGHADLLFTHNLQSADGDYFNGGGRITFGRMQLSKKDQHS